MKAKHQENINKAYRICKHIGEISIVLLLALGFSVLIKPILLRIGVDITLWSAYNIISSVYIYLAIILGIVTVLSLCCVLILGIFSKEDEEKQQFKDLIHEILDTTGEERAKVLKDNAREVECPLVNVTEDQKIVIEELLRKVIPAHAKDKNRFDRAQAWYYLTALIRKGYLKKPITPDEIDLLRAWIEQITGKYEPQEEWAHFREGFPSKNNNKVDKALKRIEDSM